MANSIRVSQRLEYVRDTSTTMQKPLKQLTIETTSDLATSNVQLVGTTHEVIAVGDVTDNAYAEIRNLHATALVSVGGDSGGSFVKWFDIPAGYPAAIIPRVGTLASSYLKSDTASTPIEVTLVKIVAPA